MKRLLLLVWVAAAAAAAGGEKLEGSALWEKLGEMMIPEFEFRDAAAWDVLADIGGISGMGVRVEPEDALEGAPPLTVHFQGASVRDVAQWVGEFLGFRAELEEDGSGWVFRREGDAGGAQGYLFPLFRLYGIEDGKKELRWTWWSHPVPGPGEEAAADFTPREATIVWDFAEIGGVGYFLRSFERQLLLEICEQGVDGTWNKVASRELGELFVPGCAGDITFDGKIGEDGDGVRVVLRRWDDMHHGEPEILRFPKWAGSER